MAQGAISPAECFSHVCVSDVLVCGEALDKHCDHLDRDMLNQAGQCNGWVEGRVCDKQIHNDSFSLCSSGHMLGYKLHLQSVKKKKKEKETNTKVEQYESRDL